MTIQRPSSWTISRNCTNIQNFIVQKYITRPLIIWLEDCDDNQNNHHQWWFIIILILDLFINRTWHISAFQGFGLNSGQPAVPEKTIWLAISENCDFPCGLTELPIGNIPPVYTLLPVGNIPLVYYFHPTSAMYCIPWPGNPEEEEPLVLKTLIRWR